MKNRIIVFAAALAGFATMGKANAQSYAYTYSRAGSVGEINWKPGEIDRQRYTLAVSPLRLIGSGLRMDFETEIRGLPGSWIGVGLIGYYAPERAQRLGESWWEREGNNRSSFFSGWDDYNQMWGVGANVFYKHHFSPRGWYYSTGLLFEYFRVGVTENDFIERTETEGGRDLTFYDYGNRLVTKPYFKPAAQINFGKHFAISERCFFDLYAGLGLAWSSYRRDDRHLTSFDSRYSPASSRNHFWYRFTGANGFAYHGLYPVGGFRFGVLLWK